MRTITLASVLLLLTAPVSRAATITVDGATCVLADAIVAANTDTAAGGCSGGDLGADVIVLDADVTLVAVDVTSTVHDGLAAALPDVTDDLTIRAGLGGVIERDPTFTCEVGTADPVFRFLNQASGTLTLENLRFEHGCAVSSDVDGGGIYSEEDTELVLDGVTVSDHTAIATTGSLRGGFLFFDGDRAVISRSTFVDMSIETEVASLDGGVLYINEFRSETLISDTLLSNFRGVCGGGIDGAAINARGGLEIVDTTFEDFTLSSDSISRGGALYGGSSSTFTLERASFRRFTVVAGGDLDGGAIYTTVEDLILKDVVFSDFDLSPDGDCDGGVINTTEDGPFLGLVVEDIRCTGGGDVRGGAVQFRNNSDPMMRDC
ncbi:MAG: hypothetical protein AAFX50_14235, partial [Acidobacteriota bacterium]